MPRLLAAQPVHLGLGATAVPQPLFTGMDWYAAYGARTRSDGAEGRLVSMYHFEHNWEGWEMHPLGAELVVCVAGAMTLRQEQPDGSVKAVTLGPGEYAINPPGIWHTADISGQASAIFITAGKDTQNRPR